MTTVLISGTLHPDTIAAFKNWSEIELIYEPDCPRPKLETLIPKANVLITRSETAVDQSLMDLAPELKVIARAAVGVGNIDLNSATERGILVINCPGKNTNSAAELTIGLALAMLRNVPQAHSHLKSGGWDRHRFAGEELRGKRIGIVGLGNVGHRVAKFAHGFDMDVSAYDPYISPAVFQRNRARQYDSLEALAKDVDILSVHVPLNKETRGMVTRDVLEAMPKGSYFINAARGGVADESDMRAVIESGHLAGCAIDTFLNEPKPMPELVQHERVWVTPHIGASTEQAQRAIGETVFAEVKKAVSGGVVDFPVNLPQIGVIDNPSVKSFSVLGEKLGAFVGQVLDFNPQSFEISYRGRIAETDHALIRLGVMKGYATQVADEYVSFVNVEKHFDGFGIKIRETEDPGFESYRSAIKIRVFGSKNDQELTVGGIVFDDNFIRISLINDFYFEMDPNGIVLVIENHDRPGVVGNVGLFLARAGVNIDTFELSRNKKGGKAMALIKLDSTLDAAALKEIGQIENITSARIVRL